MPLNSKQKILKVTGDSNVTPNSSLVIKVTSHSVVSTDPYCGAMVKLMWLVASGSVQPMSQSGASYSATSEGRPPTYLSVTPSELICRAK